MIHSVLNMKHRKVFARLLYPRFSLGARYFAVADILHAEVPKRNMNENPVSVSLPAILKCKNPNLMPIGNGFGFFAFIRDVGF